MTTKVDIFACHGVPVDVTPISRPEGVRGETVRIAANAHGSAFVHAGQDLLVREVQAEDDAPEAEPAAAAKKAK